MLETLIGAVTEAVFGYLLEQTGLGGKARALLKREPQQLAFTVAMTRTYATFDSQHPQWTESLFDETFLKNRAAPLLARALLRDNPPTSTELAQAWADQVGTGERTRAQTITRVEPVAADFLAIYEQELRARSEFQPLFDSRAHDTIAEATTQTAQSTAQTAQSTEVIAEEMRALRNELNQILAQLVGVHGRGSDQHGSATSQTNSGQQAVTNYGTMNQYNFYGDLPPADPPAGSPAPPPVPAPSSAPNPFGDTGSITDAARFFDREELLRQVFEELSKGSSISLVGESQVGKSSVLRRIEALGKEHIQPPPDHVAYLSLQHVDDEDEFYEALCESLEIATCRGGKLTRALRGRRCLLCLDEIEKMAWDGFTVKLRSHLRGLADGRDQPLTLVIASRSPLARLFPDSPELDSPLSGICRQINVEPFAPDIARAFLLHRLRGTGVTFSEAQIHTLLTQSGGHPARLQQAAADLYRRLT